MGVLIYVQRDLHVLIILDCLFYSYFISVCCIVKTIILSAIDDQMHYCTRPKAERNI